MKKIYTSFLFIALFSFHSVAQQCIIAKTTEGVTIKNFDLICDSFGNIVSPDLFNCPPANEPDCSRVTPLKNINWLNGVSTFDLILISKHILGSRALEGDQLIAADVNNSGLITAFDIIALRQLILYQIVEIPNNTSWRFVSDTETFPIDLSSASLPVEIKGIKIGDVNYSAKPTGVVIDSQETSDRGNQSPFVFNYQNPILEAGETTTVELISAQDKEMVGMQFAIDFDESALALENIEKTTMLEQMTSDNFAQQPGLLACSWHQTNSQSIRKNDVVFKLTFKALKRGRLSDWLKIDNDRMQAEIYTQEAGQIKAVELAFHPQAFHSKAPFSLYQNQPNPFHHQTQIAFHLQAASHATLRIFDITGKEVYRLSKQYDKGYQQLELSADELPTSGLYSYRLETAAGSISKKMLLVE